MPFKRKTQKQKYVKHGSYIKNADEKQRSLKKRCNNVYRGGDKTEEDASSSSESSAPLQAGEERRGRPSLVGIPLTSAEQNERKRKIYQSKKEAKRKSDLRREAAFKRWRPELFSDEISVAVEEKGGGDAAAGKQGSSAEMDERTEPCLDFEDGADSVEKDVISVETGADGDSMAIPFGKSQSSQSRARSYFNSFFVHRDDLQQVDLLRQFSLDFLKSGLKLYGIEAVRKNSCSSLSHRQLRYATSAVMKKMKVNPNLKSCIPTLLVERFDLLEKKLGRTFLQSAGLRRTHVQSAKRVDEVFEEVLSTLLRAQEESSRSFVVKVALGLCKGLELKGSRGDISIIAQKVGISRGFAKKIIFAYVEGTENVLYERKRCTAFENTTWAEKFKEFVFKPENARAVPGYETISVSRGNRLPKFLTLDSKKNIVKKFIEETKCPFSLRLLLREYPRNIVTPTRRDIDRNACPIHANFRRKWAAGQRCGLIVDDQVSCRMIVAKYMCDTIDPFTPATWNESCSTGNCKQCPEVIFPIPFESEGTSVSISLWTQKEINGRKKYGLWHVVKKIEELAAELKKDIADMKRHIYTAAVSWQKLNNDISQLRPGLDLLCFEDYQRNFEIIHREMPTSMGYSANAMTLAMFPVGLKFRRSSESSNDLTPIESGAIVFLTTDLHHDCSQVEEFERRLMKIFEEECFRPTSFIRWTDQCAAQFRSQYTTQNLFQIREKVSPHLENVIFNYFESHEGKNFSDTIGGLAKQSYERSINRGSTFNDGLGNEDETADQGLIIAEQVKARILSGLSFNGGQLGDFSFFRIEIVPPFERAPNPKGIQIKGISKIHCIRLHGKSILPKKFPCFNCTVSKICSGCETADIAYSKDVDEVADNCADLSLPPTFEEDDGDNTDNDSDGENDIGLVEDEKQFEEQDEDMEVGSILWAPFSGRRYFPAKVVSLFEIPARHRPYFTRVSDDRILVSWITENTFSAVRKCCCFPLGVTDRDNIFAAKSLEMKIRYREALKLLSNLD